MAERTAPPLVVIEPITHPMGASVAREQPDPARILIDERHAVMTQADLDRLPEYSASRPTGVYGGKMWKAYLFDADNPEIDPDDPTIEHRVWWLCWYATHADPELHWVHQRRVLVVQEAAR